MKIAFAIIGVIVILILFGTMMTGINTAKTDERTDIFAAVVTGVGETEADVVLVTDIYDDNILNVVQILSDNEDDAPLPDSYLPGSNTLTVRGLNANDTRDLEVTYQYDALTGEAEPTARFLDMLPIFVGIGALMIVVGGIVAVFINRRG